MRVIQGQCRLTGLVGLGLPDVGRQRAWRLHVLLCGLLRASSGLLHGCVATAYIMSGHSEPLGKPFRIRRTSPQTTSQILNTSLTTQDPDPKSMQNKSPKPPKTASKTIILPTFGVQAVIRYIDAERLECFPCLDPHMARRLKF